MTDSPEYLRAAGFDEAFIGLAEVWQAGSRTVAVYDAEKCIEILARDMGWEDAQEYFWVNVLGSYAGDQTPIFVFPTPLPVTKSDSTFSGVPTGIVK